MAGETWDYPPEPPPTGGPSVCPINYTLTYAREFQYDGPRQRYLNRELNPANISEIVSKTWSIYDGDTIYVDHVGAPSLYTRSYEPGMGTFSWTAGVPDTVSAQYYHTNMIGTTRMMTDSTGADVAHAAYTAFGEQRGGSPRRYGYAGAHGYQTATGSTPGDAYETGFTFQHLGHRYYDPASGRFLQRDPIGIRGGANVYGYTSNQSTGRVDPTGLYDLFEGVKGVIIGAAGAAVSGGTVGVVVIVGVIGSAVGVEKSDVDAVKDAIERNQRKWEIQAGCGPPPAPKYKPYYCPSRCPQYGTPHAHMSAGPPG